jgi:2-amino-4-hydroxy-6-hydroxymethyldihydropteridine diphosphokinase
MAKREHVACLLLGSNLHPRKNLALGVELLRQKVKIVQISSVWETPPVGGEGPNFLNLARLVTTSLGVEALKTKLLRPLEAQLGRVRSADKNAPRPIDIDIVLYDGRNLDPNLWRYAYRAVPVAEILPDYRCDQGGTIKQVAAHLARKSLIRAKSDVLTYRHLHND